MSELNTESQDLRFRDLQYFVSVASTGSFRATAQRMFASQPAISRAVARLEREIGQQLFSRGPRGAVLTPAGEATLAYAQMFTSRFAEFKAELGSGASTTLRLGAAATAAGSFLAPFLSQWIPAHPEVRIEVIEQGSVALRDRLSDGDCDLAIVALPVSREFEVLPIAEINVVAYFPAGHGLDTGEAEVGVDELARYPLLTNTSGFLSATMFAEECAGMAVFPEVRYRSNNGQTLIALAEAGLGVAVLGDSVKTSGSPLRSRAVHDSAGGRLSFSLGVAWPRKGAPEWLDEFGRSLAAFVAVDAGRTSTE